MRRRRRLTGEERELWSRVAATTLALRPSTPSCAGDPTGAPADPRPPAPQPFTAEADARAAQGPQGPQGPQGRVFVPAPAPKIRLDLAPDPRDALAGQPVAMDHKTHRAMTRGRIEPEARLDLHGMTLAEAHPELIRFVLASQAAGRRLILVITGKGKHRDDFGPIPQRPGALRHQVPQWLRLPPMGAAILQVTEAHVKHGGAGAYYVYLRRTR